MVQALDEYDIQPDLPQALRLLDEMNNNFQQVSDLVGNMLQRVKTGELSTEYGLSFLEIKYHMLLNYLINLTYVVLRKCSGHKIEKDPSIDRLIEIRTVLEKIRPIDYKLRYQIDKLVKTAVTGSSSLNDPTSFKANPDNLMSQLPGADNESEESDDSDAEKTKSKGKDKSLAYDGGVYVPPKLLAVHYEDDSKAERTRKQMERAKKRALGSSMMQDLKDEYLDIPLEITGGSRAQNVHSKAEREKEEYEENYLTRLPITKAEKQRQMKLTTLGSLGDEITSFGDFSALDGGASTSGGRKRKGAKTGSSKKRGGNKKRKFR